LPVFCSDPISSVAYATEQIVLVLAAGGLAALSQTPWVGLAVVVLLVVVVASYRQTCFAYPNGGGAFVVSRDNLGETAALVAASALLVDYVMTVAVSVVSGVVAITSALPGSRRTRWRCRSGSSWCSRWRTCAVRRNRAGRSPYRPTGSSA
jgi:amino acid transporter